MIYISIGSNQGHRLFNIQHALDHLKKINFTLLKLSPIIETDALLPDKAPPDWNHPYLNMVIAGKSDLTPPELLKKLKSIEKKLGRKTVYPKWSPRVIDLDILLFNNLIVNNKNLILPHPELSNRPFLIHLMNIITPSSKLNPHIIIKKSFAAYPKLVGIVNITPDSCSDSGLHLKPDNAVKHALNLYNDGAHIIELGAVSTRPGAAFVSPKQEYQRLLPVLDKLHSKLPDHILSIDSFSPDIILNILNNKKHARLIRWINLQQNINPVDLNFIAKQNCHIVLMHSVSLPAHPEKGISLTQKPIQTIIQWAEKSILSLKKSGFAENKIILDPGIGFGKNHYQNIELLKTLTLLQKIGYPLLIGHSRKSFLSAFNSHSTYNNRDIETLAISDYLANIKIDYLRVHDIALHQRFFSTRAAMV